MKPSDLTPDDATLARAEDVVGRASEKIGDWIARRSVDVIRAAARAREEAEDVWAEARALSHDDRPADI